tara:strand:+ start:575 stop:1498 length:924 start_codon:yes stop_codon:yes gene_type:complete
MRRLYIYILLLSFNLFSQNVTLEVDTVNLRIGEQFHAVLKIHNHALNDVTLPPAKTTFNNFELINNPVLSAYSDSDTTYLYKQFLLTSFDTGQFVLNAVPVVLNNKDSIFSNSLVVNFLSVPVDTANNFFDIKPPKKIPFLARELLVYIPYLLLILFICLVSYFFFKYWNKKNNNLSFSLQKPSVPIDVYFLARLDGLLQQDYLKNKKYKQFYTELSEIFRGYLELRFDVPALESSTYELKLFLTNLSINEDWVSAFLRESDIVKFAKGISSEKKGLDFVKQIRSFIVKLGAADAVEFEQSESKLKI